MNWNHLDHPRKKALVLGSALAAFVVLGMTATLAVSKPEAKPKPAAPEGAVTRESAPRASYAPVVKQVSPSVVKVFTTTKSKKVGFGNQQPPGMPFFPFFFDDQNGLGGRREMRTPPQHGVGSGVVVSKDGYILTNEHVVDGADEVKVAFQDGEEYTAKVVGKDSKTDVAVLKVDAKELPAIVLGDSDQIEVGDVVLAVGNPFGIGQTVTMGMVSATGRATLGLDYEDFIQTDAAINPGNSGGALVDSEGRLVGVNTAILSRSGGNQGIGFAIPVNLARDVMDSLIKDGKVTRGYLGVMIQDLTPKLAKEFGVNHDQKGVLIGDVVKDGPAAGAGLKDGDVVTEFDSKKVVGSRQLKLQVARTKPGSTVPVEIVREGKAKTIRVKVAELPTDEKVARAEGKSSEGHDALDGVAVGEIDPRSRRQLELPANVKGALVTEVEPGSAASEAGLRPGDVIVEINRQPVRNADDAVRLTEKAADKTTLVRVWSQGGTRYLVVDEEKAG